MTACLDALSRRGCRARVVETTAPGEAETIARAADPGETDAIVAAGGDGTIHEIVNGLCGTTLPLGIIPLGTANVLAAELGQDPAPDRVADTLARGRRWRVRLGRIDSVGFASLSRAATPVGRRFLLMAGAGLDAQVVASVNLGLKRLAGKFAYVWGACVEAFSYRFPPLTVRIDDVAHAAFGAIVCRARHYGGAFIVAPRARLNADMFQVCLLKQPGAVNALRYATALMRGNLAAQADVEIMMARHIVIDGPAGAPVQVDGDIRARLPAVIDMAQETIELIVPANGPLDD